MIETILGGTVVLFIGFSAKKIWNKFFPSNEQDSFEKIENNQNITVVNNIASDLNNIKNKIYLNEAECQIFQEVSRFYLSVEAKLAYFYEIYTNTERFSEEFETFNYWQYKEVMKLRENIKSNANISEDFEKITLYLLGAIYNTVPLREALVLHDNSEKLSKIGIYLTQIETRYSEFKKFKNN